ncbi:MAG: TIGR01212 family radical SAM protein [Paludibacteraceae bacterium]|jgi:radical SAM protein (TIGR01212 family)|nr:TIGR01212 family radical SAM protein [Paludibacteraceae bacterium]
MAASSDKIKRYRTYSDYLSSIFPTRVQKISINAGFTCPNRDGRVGVGGCTYCNNQTFNPEYCKSDKSVSQQIEEGINFFRKKYENQLYLAYFQAYTNTYGSLSELKAKYEEALSHEGVVGLVIGTRPDCVDDELLDYLSFLARNYYIMVEFGVESTNDETLKFINRGHDFEAVKRAVQAASGRGLHTCAHLILGLPKEDREMILSHADRISELPLDVVKLHQLQLIKGTVMARQFEENPEWFHLYGLDEYIGLLVDFIERLNPKFVIERFVSQSPKNLLIAPDWGVKNYEFTSKLEKELDRRDALQGRFFR